MKSCVAVFISGKLDFQIRNMMRDKERYFIMIKELNH